VSKEPEFVCGQEHRAPFPFTRDTYEGPPDDPEGTMFVKVPTWKPGAELGADEYEEWCVADGVGEVVYNVIAVFKPGSFPTRVFYTRNWIDPDGKRFGKNKLRITTAHHFRTLINGYRHAYELTEE
jgi:hypothetical protein